MCIDTDKAWAAGFIDGEGCFYSARQRDGDLVVKIIVTQKYRLPLDRLTEVLGLGYVSRRTDGQWAWAAQSGKQVRSVLDSIEQYMVAKKDQAEIMRMICDTITRRRNPDWDHRLQLIGELRSAKRLGEPAEA